MSQKLTTHNATAANISFTGSLPLSQAAHEWLQASPEVGQQFAERYAGIMQSIMTGEAVSGLCDKYIVVVGMPRTGGTFLTDLFLQEHGYPTCEGRADFRFVHDGCPEYGVCVDYSHPRYAFPFLSEMAQVLSWSTIVFDSVAVQKRIAYGHCLRPLKELLGDRLEVHVMFRGVEPAATSFAKHVGCRDWLSNAPGSPLYWERWARPGDDWSRMGYFQRFARYWEAYYTDVLGEVSGCTLHNYDTMDFEGFDPVQREYAGFFKDTQMERIMESRLWTT